MNYDIFISYRRKGGYETAKHLYDLLTRDGYAVSFDIDTLRNGDFDTALLQRIEECTDFILILNEGAFDRTLDPAFNPKNDWMRNELAHALKHNKNVIPVMLEGFDSFPEDLPDDICKVVRKNGPKYDSYYFDDFYRKMKKSFFETPEPVPQAQHTSVSKSSIKFKSNLCCDYYIDGEYQERIDKDTLHQISLPQGEYFFEFVSAYDAGVDRDSRMLKLTGEDVAFEIDLNTIAEHRQTLEQRAKEVIESKYNSHNDFCGGLCLVERNGLYGYLNSKLEEIIPFIYEDASDFKSYTGTALVKRYGKYGTIDLKGKQCIPLEYDKLGGEKNFSGVTEGDYVRCLKDGKCGVLNLWGEVVLPLEYEALGDVWADHCITVTNKKAGLYNLKSRELVLPIVHEKLILNDGHAIFYQDGQCGLYFLDGSLTIKARYDEILPFREGLAAVKIGRLWGFIDKSDNLVISPKFDECKQFSCGLAAVRKGNKWAYIDHTGKEVIAYKYDEAGLMLAGVAIVKIGDTAGVIDRCAHQIYPMTKGVELRQSTLAYNSPDQAFPVLALVQDGTLELITPHGKIHKLTKEQYWTWNPDNTQLVLLTYNNTEHLFSHTHETDAELNLTKYDSEVELFEPDSENAKSEKKQSEVYGTIVQIIARYFDKDASTIGPDANLRSGLGADEDDITDIMMRIEEELAVLVDSESYFRSLDSIQEIADYISVLVAADADGETDDELLSQADEGESGSVVCTDEPEQTASVKEQIEPVQAPQPRFKRGDLYVADGVEGIVLEFDEVTGTGKLVSKKRIVNTWEDPSFAGFAKKIQPNARLTPIDANHADGSTNCHEIRQTKGWDWKYPCVWWCVNLDGGIGKWYLPAYNEFGRDFNSPEVQRHYAPITGEDELNKCPAYWTSNTKNKGKDDAIAVLPSGSGYAANRKSRYFLVAMRYFKI